MNTILFALSAYPVATASAITFYVFTITLLLPRIRAAFLPWLTPTVRPDHHYLLAFDTFRGFSALIVTIGHFWWATYPVFDEARTLFPFVPYAAKGVSMFAALSGFLIYRSVLDIKSIPTLRIYAIRRFFRIYPVYLLSVALCMMTHQYQATDQSNAIQFMFGDLFMFHVVGRPDFANPVTWTLYIEAAFYALLPLVVIVVQPRRMIAFSIILVIAMIWADHNSRDYALWRYFLFGILAAELSPYVRRGALILFGVGIALLVADFGGPDYNWAAHLIGRDHPDGQTLGLGVACLLILSSLPWLHYIARALNIFPFRLLGLVSYSLYVTHIFFISANFPVIGPFTRYGTMGNFELLKTLTPMPIWYVPFVFLPGALIWALVAYFLVERPGIAVGQAVARRIALPN